MTGPLRVGLVGIGTMGRNHARVLSDAERTTLVAAADPDAAARRYVERQTRAAAYEDHVRMLERDDLDAVVVAVPTESHAEVARAAIARGLHVLVEKPLAATSADARTIVDAARTAGVCLAVGHVERFNPAIADLKARLGRGELGGAFVIQTRRQSPFPAHVRDVGVAVDLGTHDIDLMRHLLGDEPVRAYAVTARRVHGEREDLLHGVLTFANGVIGTLDVNWLTPAKVRELAVVGERGMFVVHHLAQELSFYSNARVSDDRQGDGWSTLAQLVGVAQGNVTRYAIAHREPLVAELDDFASACLEGRDPAVSGEDGIRALEIAEALLRSAAERRPVELSESPGLRPR